jgi:hypothetical protein
VTQARGLDFIFDSILFCTTQPLVQSSTKSYWSCGLIVSLLSSSTVTLQIGSLLCLPGYIQQYACCHLAACLEVHHIIREPKWSNWSTNGPLSLLCLILFVLVSVSSLEKKLLKEERYIWAHGFRSLFHSHLVPPIWAWSEIEGVWESKAGHLTEAGKERDRGKRLETRYTLQGHPSDPLPLVRPTFHSFHHLPIVHSIMDCDSVKGLIHWLSKSPHNLIISEKKNPPVNIALRLSK